MRTRHLATVAALALVLPVVAGCSDDPPAPEPVRSVDGTPVELDDAALAGYAATEYEDAWLCGTLPPEIADPVLAGAGRVEAVGFFFEGDCRVTRAEDDGTEVEVLDVRTSGSTELVPDAARGVLDQRVRIDLSGGVDGWVVEVPPFFGSARGVVARAVGRTSEGEPRAVAVHLTPGTDGRDLAADAEVLLRYYVLRGDVTAPLVGQATPSPR
ncbi:hypothetical protein WDZ16_09445 [Pseudokineococcus marinus]|uniref:Lipoprotein n=1 Tax=Pseudokineococcus marinus TaxID=351215 RepID=A0A849BG73_9ACTN|nr:hypothetical protein [Pseudokineococcus marinus]NNH21561.1 hypothetical protein [Pseudokineococcus marinus]